MKKLLCGCLIFLEAVALSLALCAGNGGRGTPAKAESDSFVGTEITYDASVYEDYYIGQEKQGDNGWYLYGGSVEEGYSELSAVGRKYNSDADCNLWKKDDNGETWNGIWWRNEFHCFGMQGVVAVWKAPSSGSVRFKGKIENSVLGSTAQGYEVNVYRRDQSACTLVYGETASKDYAVNLSGKTFEVKKNEKFLFEMNPLCADEMKCNYYVKAAFVSAGTDAPDPQDEYEKYVPGLNDTASDNEYYKFSAEYAQLPDSDLTAGFSQEQGTGGVWYLKGDVEKKYERMKFDGENWQGETYQKISSSYEFTTGENGSNTMLMYRAQADGKLEAIIREKNTSFSDSEGCDGVRFRIAVRRYDRSTYAFSDAQTLFEREAEPDAYFVKTSVLTLPMSAGDMLFLIVEGKETSWCDHYFVMPKFNYTASGEAVTLPDDIGAEPLYEEQFGADQGYCNWYYMTGFEDEYYRMIYDAGEFVGIESYNSVSASYMTPGNGMAAIRMYACTDTGKIDVRGYLQKVDHKAAEVGDGVGFRYYLLGETPFLDRHIDGDDYTVYDLSRVIDVKKGDILVFYVDSGGNNYNSYDTVTLNAYITYVESAGDADETFDLGDRGVINGYPLRPQYISEEEAQAYYGKEQGENGWYYAYGSVEKGYYLMDYDVFGDVWKNPSVDTFTRLSKGSLHPGYDNEECILIKRIDQAGKIRLMSYYNLHDGDGDGVVVNIYYNGALLNSEELTTTDRRYYYKDIEVSAGDLIFLSIGNKEGHENSFDNTSATLVAAYLETSGEAVEFTDDEVGQKIKAPSVPDDKLTPVKVRHEGAGSGCKSSLAATGLAGLSVGIAALVIKRRKQR